MGALTIEYQPTEVLLRIKRPISEATLKEFKEWLEIKLLIDEVDFDDSIQTIGNEMKSHWWERNKHKFIKDEQ